MSLALAFLGNRWGQMLVVAAACYFYGFYSVPRPDIQAIVRNAQEGRDAHWKDVLRQKERDNEEAVQNALEAAKSEPDTPADMAERLRLCRESPTCRDRSRQ